MGFDVARTGVASVGFVGFPSVGKVRNEIQEMSDMASWISFLVHINVKVNWHTFRSLGNRLHYAHHGSRNVESAWCTNTNPRSP